MKKLKLCVVTGSRAEYGLLYPLLCKIKWSSRTDLQLVVTGSHLATEFGATYRQIKQDGFRIAFKIPILGRWADACAVTKAMGRAVTGFGEAYKQLIPDWVIVLGDRYEILAAVSAALIAKIPVAHIAGGDITEGAFDDAIRHAITKMSHLHFVTNAHSARCVRQMGEDPKNILNVGHLGLDYIRRMKFHSRARLERLLGFKFHGKNILVTFHPVTLSETSSETQFAELLNALGRLDQNVGVIITKPNADPGGLKLIAMLTRFAKGRRNVKIFPSLGQELYLNVMRCVDAVVGNSSSGIYEAPSFKVPTVNIGDRQKGRLLAASVIGCPPEARAISTAIRRAFSKKCADVRNPYGGGNVAQKILAKIRSVNEPRKILKKRFAVLERV